MFNISRRFVSTAWRRAGVLLLALIVLLATLVAVPMPSAFATTPGDPVSTQEPIASQSGTESDQSDDLEVRDQPATEDSAPEVETAPDLHSEETLEPGESAGMRAPRSSIPELSAKVVPLFSAEGGILAGTVKAETGEPLSSGVSVTAFRGATQDWTDAHHGFVGTDGAFEFSGLPAGEYRVEVQTHGINYLSEWNGDAESFATAVPINVSAGAAATMDFVLTPGATISGRLASALGEAVTSGVMVTAHRATSMYMPMSTSTGQIQPDGSFQIVGLRAGEYRVVVSAMPGTNFLALWNGGAPSFDEASPIQVVERGSVADVDFVLQTGGIIRGTVTSSTGDPISTSVSVSAYDPSGGASNYNALADSAGEYVLAGLPSGSYLVSVDVFGDTAYLGEYFSNARNAEQATLVEVGTGVTSIADFQLERAASISGRVTDSRTGEPLQGMEVSAFPAEDPNNTYARTALTDASGAFTIKGLAPTNYKLLFGGVWTPLSHDRVWWGGGATFDGASIVSLAEGQQKNGFNVAAAPIGTVSPAAAPGVTMLRDADILKVRWTKPASIEPIIGYVLQYSLGSSGDGQLVVGGDSQQIDLPAQYYPADESVLVSVAAVTATAVGAFGFGVNVGTSALAAPTVELTGSTDTSLTFAASADISDAADLSNWAFHLYGPAGETLNEWVENTHSGIATVTFEGLSPGENYDLFVLARTPDYPGNATRWGALRGLTTGGVLSVPAATPVTGAVVAKDSSGAGVDGAKILLESGSCDDGGAGVWENTTATSQWSTGGFGVSLLPGEYCVTAKAVPLGFEAPAPSTVKVTAPGPVWITVWLAGSALVIPDPVTGAVVAKDSSGAGVDGAKVLLTSGSCESAGAGVWENTTATSRWSTGGFGVSLMPGKYCVMTRAVPTGFEAPAPFTVNVVAPSPVWITVWLSGAAPLSVTGAVVAKDSSGAGIDGVKVLLEDGACGAGGVGVWENTTASSRWSVGGFGVSLVAGKYCVTTKSVPVGFAVPAPQTVLVSAPSPVWITVWVSRAPFAGTGDSFVPIDVVSGEKIFAFSCPACTSNVIVWAHDADGPAQLLVNRIGSYEGRQIIGFRDWESMRYTGIEVKAKGSWSFELLGLSSATTAPSRVTGSGDDVVRFTAPGTAANISNSGTGYFGVWSEDSRGDVRLLVSEIGTYWGSHPLRSPSLVQVTSDGDWQISVG